MEINPKRIRKLNDKDYISGSIIYWMTREQRVHDNWSLLTAQASALKYKQPLVVLFCLQESFLKAERRQYNFMLDGLELLEFELQKFHIPLVIQRGKPRDTILRVIKSYTAGALITDFSPLRIAKKWKKEVLTAIDIPLWEVDAHNIVPIWVASDKQEYSARTIRPKINPYLSEFSITYPKLEVHPFGVEDKIDNKILELKNRFYVQSLSNSENTISSGEIEAKRELNEFIKNRLKYYSEYKNNPLKAATSNLSAYLHFGQISSQTILNKIEKTGLEEDITVFMEELVVRKELADNFCYYNHDYDNFKGMPQWAKKTLNEHRKDKRQYIYTLEQFEKAETHDELWNACQQEMLLTGKMHGYLRMYWAKKILEWTATPEEAFQISVYLNDKYELDGRDPNGYTGIAWAIGGLHDRPWFPRPVFGNIRYMSVTGMKKKFDVKAYTSKYIQ